MGGKGENYVEEKKSIVLMWRNRGGWKIKTYDKSNEGVNGRWKRKGREGWEKGGLEDTRKCV